MTDFYIAFTLLGVTFAGAIVYAIFKRLHMDSQPYTPETSFSAPDDYRYNPATSIVETNAGFTGGLIIGAALNKRYPHPARTITRTTTVIANVLVVDDVFSMPISTTYQDDTLLSIQQPSDPQPEAFTGFSGGDSAGGGATNSWDSPTDSCPVDNGPAPDNSDSSSSNDSGSSDYGSSSSDSSNSCDSGGSSSGD